MTEIVWAKRGDDEAVADHIEAALRPGGTLALPGESAAGAVVRSLAGRPLAWADVAFSLTDDLEVPPDHPASGFGRLEERLGPTGTLLTRFAPVWDGFRFRLVWVEVAEDGRVASIFPESGLDEAAPPTVVRVRPPRAAPHSRLARATLNYSGLTATDALILVIRGAARKALVEAAVAGDSDLPVARLLRRAECPVTIFWSSE